MAIYLHLYNKTALSGAKGSFNFFSVWFTYLEPLNTGNSINTGLNEKQIIIICTNSHTNAIKTDMLQSGGGVLFCTVASFSCLSLIFIISVFVFHIICLYFLLSLCKLYVDPYFFFIIICIYYLLLKIRQIEVRGVGVFVRCRFLWRFCFLIRSKWLRIVKEGKLSFC